MIGYGLKIRSFGMIRPNLGFYLGMTIADPYCGAMNYSRAIGVELECAFQPTKTTCRFKTRPFMAHFALSWPLPLASKT